MLAEPEAGHERARGHRDGVALAADPHGRQAMRWLFLGGGFPGPHEHLGKAGLGTTQALCNHSAFETSRLKLNGARDLVLMVSSHGLSVSKIGEPLKRHSPQHSRTDRPETPLGCTLMFRGAADRSREVRRGRTAATQITRIHNSPDEERT